jgi:hypothetical protein
MPRSRRGAVERRDDGARDASDADAVPELGTAVGQLQVPPPLTVGASD